MDGFLSVFYRGSLKSCNYNCPYCPFRKKIASKEDLARDREALERFCEKAPTLGDSVSVMLVPYGEAMIHPYYHEAVKRLCKAGAIDKVGFQSNLSFSVEDFLGRLSDLGAGLQKLRLWCTFHPCGADPDQFLEKCLLLYHNEIRFSVGAVGVPKNIKLLSELRRRLPPDIYMWVNAAEGMRREYTQNEIEEFLRIDPLFNYELTDYPADAGLCTGGKESIFVEANGDVFACVISKKRLENIYSSQTFTEQTLTDPGSKICSADSCHCYLAYSNRKDIFDIPGFNEGNTFRIPNRQRAFFFDVDGTLTDGTGKIPPENIRAIERIALDSLVFLATSLPFSFAAQACEEIWQYISGGVFAEGSDIRIFSAGFKRIIPLDESIPEALPAGTEFSEYREDGVLHKVTLPAQGEKFVCAQGVRCVSEDGICGIVSNEATKLNGVIEICRRLQIFEPFVTVAGNSRNDIPMLKHFSNSICVPGSGPEVIAAAKKCCFISSIQVL